MDLKDCICNSTRHLQPKNQDIKQKQYCNKFNKDVKKTVLNATLYFKKLVFLNPSLLLITPSIHQ